MGEKIDVTWHLRADVNATGFTLSGSGNADLLNGATSLELMLDPKLPSGFDPAVSQFICNFALAGYAAVSDASITLRDAVDRQLFVRPAA